MSRGGTPRIVFDRSETAKRRRIYGAFFVLSTSPAAGGRIPRVACIVSKKIAAKAVDRNRIKRRCREAARTHAQRVPKSLTLVFWARREAARATFADIGRDVHSLIEQLSRGKVQY